MNRATRIVFLVGFLTGCAVAWLASIAVRYREAGMMVQTQNEIGSFEEQLVLGETRSELRSRFDANDFRTIALREEGRILYVSGAEGLGAEGWVLVLEFGPEDTLLAVRYSTHDGHRPPGTRPERRLVPG